MTNPTNPDGLVFARMVAEQFTRLTDAITSQAMNVVAEEPRKPDGSIADPYWRGVADGISTVATGLRQGFKQAIAEFEAQRETDD